MCVQRLSYFFLLLLLFFVQCGYAQGTNEMSYEQKVKRLKEITIELYNINEALRQDCQTLKQSLRASGTRISDLQTSIENYEKQIAMLYEQLEASKIEASELEEALMSLQRSLTDYKKEVNKKIFKLKLIAVSGYVISGTFLLFMVRY